MSDPLASLPALEGWRELPSHRHGRAVWRKGKIQVMADLVPFPEYDPNRFEILFGAIGLDWDVPYRRPLTQDEFLHVCESFQLEPEAFSETWGHVRFAWRKLA